MDFAKWSIGIVMTSVCNMVCEACVGVLPEAETIVYMGLVIGLLFMNQALAQGSSRIHVLRVAVIGVQKLASHQVEYSHYTTPLLWKSINIIYIFWKSVHKVKGKPCETGRSVIKHCKVRVRAIRDR